MRTLVALILGLALWAGPARAQPEHMPKPPGAASQFQHALMCNTKDELYWAIDNLPTLMAVSRESDESPDAETQINEHFKDRGEAECTGSWGAGYYLEGENARMSPVDPASGLISVFRIRQVELTAIFIDGASGGSPSGTGLVELPHSIIQWLAEGIESHRAEEAPTDGPFSVREEGDGL